MQAVTTLRTRTHSQVSGQAGKSRRFLRTCRPRRFHAGEFGRAASVALWLSLSVGVVGVMAQTSASPGVGASTRLAERLAEQENGFSTGSYFGIGVAEATQEMAAMLKMDTPRGVVITSVTNGSPADKAGLRVKDVLVSVDGDPVESGNQMLRIVSQTPPGRTVRLGIVREGQLQELSLVAAARRVSLSNAASVTPVKRMAATQPTAPAEVPKLTPVFESLALGIESEALNPQLASFFGVRAGVLVREVGEDSPAARAGVRAGDVIIHFGEVSVNTPADLSRVLHDREGEESLKLGVVRNRREVIFAVAPKDIPRGNLHFSQEKTYRRTPTAIPVSQRKGRN